MELQLSSSTHQEITNTDSHTAHNNETLSVKTYFLRFSNSYRKVLTDENIRNCKLKLIKTEPIKFLSVYYVKNGKELTFSHLTPPLYVQQYTKLHGGGLDDVEVTIQKKAMTSDIMKILDQYETKNYSFNIDSIKKKKFIAYLGKYYLVPSKIFSDIETEQDWYFGQLEKLKTKIAEILLNGCSECIEFTNKIKYDVFSEIKKLNTTLEEFNEKEIYGKLNEEEKKQYNDKCIQNCKNALISPIITNLEFPFLKAKRHVFSQNIDKLLLMRQLEKRGFKKRKRNDPQATEVHIEEMHDVTEDAPFTNGKADQRNQLVPLNHASTGPNTPPPSSSPAENTKNNSPQEVDIDKIDLVNFNYKSNSHHKFKLLQQQERREIEYLVKTDDQYIYDRIRYVTMFDDLTKLINEQVAKDMMFRVLKTGDLVSIDLTMRVYIVNKDKNKNALDVGISFTILSNVVHLWDYFDSSMQSESSASRQMTEGMENFMNKLKEMHNKGDVEFEE